MSHDPHRLRERIHEALADPVEEAEKLLSELTSASTEARLAILISGWGRGLAAALEELAVAIDELRGTPARAMEEPASAPPARTREQAPPQPDEGGERADAAGLDEGRLLDEAKRSREATADLRREAEELRRDLEEQ